MIQLLVIWLLWSFHLKVLCTFCTSFSVFMKWQDWDLLKIIVTMTEFSGQHLLMQHSSSLITAYFYDKMAVVCSHYMYVVRQFKWKHGPLLRTLDEQGNWFCTRLMVLLPNYWHCCIAKIISFFTKTSPFSDVYTHVILNGNDYCTPTVKLTQA